EPEPSPNNWRTVSVIAWGLFWLSVAFVAGGMALEVWVLAATGRLSGLELHTLFGPLATLTFALVGALVTTRQPRHPVGWICSACGVLGGLNWLGAGYGAAGTLGVALPGAALMYWLELWVWVPVPFLPLSFLLLLFPDGHLPSPRWWPVGWAAGLATAAAV